MFAQWRGLMRRRGGGISDNDTKSPWPMTDGAVAAAAEAAAAGEGAAGEGAADSGARRRNRGGGGGGVRSLEAGLRRRLRQENVFSR